MGEFEGDLRRARFARCKPLALRLNKEGCLSNEHSAPITSGNELYEGLSGFRFALRRFLAFSEAVSGEAGVTPQQYQALLEIKTHPEGAIMVRDLAERMLLKPNGAVQMVDRLVNAELVTRKSSPTDRRSVLVSLTDKGEALLDLLANNHIKELLRREPLLAESLKRLRRLGK